MYSIQFPDMLSSTATNIVKDHDATLSNLKLILTSDKYSLFGDPYFGTNLKRLLFEQDNIILKDIVIDDIYTTINTFMPQILVNRKDIEIISNKETVLIKIRATNLLDLTTNLYTINMIDKTED